MTLGQIFESSVQKRHCFAICKTAGHSVLNCLSVVTHLLIHSARDVCPGKQAHIYTGLLELVNICWTVDFVTSEMKEEC